MTLLADQCRLRFYLSGQDRGHTLDLVERANSDEAPPLSCFPNAQRLIKAYVQVAQSLVERKSKPFERRIYVTLERYRQKKWQVCVRGALNFQKGIGPGCVTTIPQSWALGLVATNDETKKLVRPIAEAQLG